MLDINFVNKGWGKGSKRMAAHFQRSGMYVSHAIYQCSHLPRTHWEVNEYILLLCQDYRKYNAIPV